MAESERMAVHLIITMSNDENYVLLTDDDADEASVSDTIFSIFRNRDVPIAVVREPSKTRLAFLNVAQVVSVKVLEDDRELSDDKWSLMTFRETSPS